MRRNPARRRRVLSPCRYWLFGWLALAAGLLWAGTPRRQQGPALIRSSLAATAPTTAQAPPPPRLGNKNIEDVHVGDRVAGRNPLREQVETVVPDPTTWRKISLRIATENGLQLWIELLRPVAWIEENSAAPGRMIDLELAEMGAVGEAVVTAIEPCAPIKPGDGTVVTGTFVHECDGSNVVALRLEGQDQATRVTSNHLYWSEDRRDFLPVGELRIGEHVDTEFGRRAVASISPSAYRGLIYNLETTEHVYRVDGLGTLVHNTCPIVLGETMSRVTSVAKAIGAATFKPRGLNPLRYLTNQKVWIGTQIRSGRPIL